MNAATPLLEDPRIEQILGMVEHLASGDGRGQGTPSTSNDALDQIITGLNDLAEKMAARQAVYTQTREAQERLTTLLEATPDFVGVAETNGRMRYLNPAGRHFLTGSCR